MGRRNRSTVWLFFQEDKKRREVKCTICGQIHLRQSSSTTSLLRHLKGKHPEEFEQSLQREEEIEQSDEVNDDPSYHPSPSKMKKLANNTTSTFTISTDSDRDGQLVEQFVAMANVDLNPGSSSADHHDEQDHIPNRSQMTRKKSPIWKFFEPGPGNKYAECALCKDVLRHHGNTSTLNRHLRSKHAAASRALTIPVPRKGGLKLVGLPVKQEPRASSTSFSNNFNGNAVAKLGTGDDGFNKLSISNAGRHKILDQKVMTMIIMDLLPVSSVESKYFVDVMKFADPRYRLPTKNAITSELLPKLYKDTVDQILTRLENVKHVAITTELWSPRHQESYLGISAHFICPDKWTLQSFMLSTTTFFGTPTGTHIASELERTVAEWNITDKVRVMVTDKETNALLSNEQLPWAYIPCPAHLIHIVITDAISTDTETTALIEKVSGIVRYFKGDEDSKVKLAESQRSLNLPQHKLLSQYVPSRWNSIYFMLERVLEQIDAINEVLAAYEKEEMCLTSQDRDILKMVIAALKPFEIATKTMASEKSRTIGTAMPLVKGLLKMMSCVAGGKEPLTTALKEGLAESFGKIEDIDWILAATVLDPRFKKCPYTENDVIVRAKEIVTAEITSIWQPETSSADDPEDTDSLWVYLDDITNSVHVQEQKREETPPAAILELHRYLESPPASRDDNPLLYWRQHQELFPTLCQLAMKYLTVPITSIPTERLFTKAGESLDEKRSKLSSKSVNMMLFLNSNMPHVSQI